MHGRQTTVSMTVLMTPDMANFSGNVHGGGILKILKILDQVAFACASTTPAAVSSRCLSTGCCSANPSTSVISSPSPPLSTTPAEHQWRSASASILSIFNVEQPGTNSCYFTTVAVGSDGRPVEIPALQPKDPVAVKRFQNAHRRREAQRKHFQDSLQ